MLVLGYTGPCVNRDHVVKIKEKIIVPRKTCLIVPERNVIDVDLVGSKDCLVILMSGAVLLNRAANLDEDQTIYHLGDYSYLNFTEGNSSKKYSHQIFRSLYGPSFVEYAGPRSLKELIIAQSGAAKKTLRTVPIHHIHLRTVIDAVYAG